MRGTRYVPGERTVVSRQKNLRHEHYCCCTYEQKAVNHKQKGLGISMHQHHHVPYEYCCTSMTCHALPFRSCETRRISRAAHHPISHEQIDLVLNINVWENRAATAVRRAPWTDQPRLARPLINITETGSRRAASHVALRGTCYVRESGPIPPPPPNARPEIPFAHSLHS